MSGLMFRFLLLLVPAGLVSAQSGKVADAGRPPCSTRSDFRETSAAMPIMQGHLSSSDLVLALYGPGTGGMKKSHHDTPADDPWKLRSHRAFFCRRRRRRSVISKWKR